MKDIQGSANARTEDKSGQIFYDTHIRPALLAIERRELEERRRREELARQEQERREAEMEQGFEELRDMLSRMADARQTAPLPKPEPEPEYEPEFFDDGDIEGRLDAILDRLDALADGQKRIEARMDGMDARMDAVEQSMQSLADRLDGMDKRLDRVDERLDSVDKRLDSMDKPLDRVEQSMSVMQAEHKPLGAQAGAISLRPARTAAPSGRMNAAHSPESVNIAAQAITGGAPPSAGASFLPSRAPSRAPPGRPMTPGRVVRHYTLHPRDPPWA